MGPAIGAAWRRAWDYVAPFFAFAPGIRKMIYTTNAVEALHRSLRKIIKTRGSFPNDDAALKLLYLAIKNAGMRWRRNIEWTSAMGHFAWSARSPSSPAPAARPVGLRGLTARCGQAKWPTGPLMPHYRWTETKTNPSRKSRTQNF